MKVRSISNPHPGGFTHTFYCEGCECHHGFRTGVPDHPRWGYNNDPERPTLEGSVLVRGGDANGPTVCHSFVRDGNIQYLTDSTHRLAGQTVPLLDI